VVDGAELAGEGGDGVLVSQVDGLGFDARLVRAPAEGGPRR
jgi:hypothetical protein